jgi:hypothetical protein
LIILLLIARALQPQEKTGKSVSAARNEAARYFSVIKELTARGVPFEERKLFARYGTFGSSIFVFIPPAQETDADAASFVLAVPLSAPSDFPFALAMEFIEKARLKTPPMPIYAAFLGGETSSLPPALRKDQRTAQSGLQDLLSQLPNPEKTAIWYFALEEDNPQQIFFTRGAKKNVTPLEMLKSLPDLCEKYAVPYEFALINNALFRSDLVDVSEIFNFAKKNESNLLFITSKENDKNKNIVLSIPLFADMLIDYIFKLDLSDPDTNYLFFPAISEKIGKNPRFIPTDALVAITFAFSTGIFLLFLIISIIRRKYILLRWKIFFSYLWIIFVFFFLLSLALAITTACVSIITKNTRKEVLDILLAAILSAPLYWLFISITKNIKILGKKYLLEYAAVVSGLFNFLLLLFLQIKLLPAAAAALICIIIGSVFKNAALSYIMGIITLFQSFIFIAYLFNNGVIENNYIIYTAFILFPAVLAFQRTDFIFFKYKKYAKPVKILSRLVYAAICLFAVIHFLPRSNENSSVIIEQKKSGVLHIYYDQSRFLERRILNFSFINEITPIRFDISLQSNDGNPPPLYAISFNNEYAPYKRNAEKPDRIDFLFGENPPNPLNFTLTIEYGFSGVLSASVVYYNQETLAYERYTENIPIGESQLRDKTKYGAKN